MTSWMLEREQSRIWTTTCARHTSGFEARDAQKRGMPLLRGWHFTGVPDRTAVDSPVEEQRG